MIYNVSIDAPAIHEDVTTEADNQQQAKERAVYSSLQRQLKAATVSVSEIPPGSQNPPPPPAGTHTPRR